MSENEPTRRNTFYIESDHLVKKAMKAFLVIILFPTIITYNLITYLLFSIFPTIYFYSALFMKNTLIFFLNLRDHFHNISKALMKYIIKFTEYVNTLYEAVSNFIGRFINNNYLFLNNLLSKLLSLFLQLYKFFTTFLETIHKILQHSINFIYHQMVNIFINKYSNRIWNFIKLIIPIIYQFSKETIIYFKSLIVKIGYLIRTLYSLLFELVYENFCRKIIYNMLLLKGLYLIKLSKEIIVKFILINLLRCIQFLEKFIVGFLFKYIQIYFVYIYHKVSEFIKNILEIVLSYIDILLGILIEKYSKIKNFLVYLKNHMNNMIIWILDKAISIIRNFSNFFKTLLVYIGNLIYDFFTIVINTLKKLFRLINNAIFFLIKITYSKLRVLLRSLYLLAYTILDKLIFDSLILIQGLVSFSLDKLTELYLIKIELISIFFHKLINNSQLLFENFLVFIGKSLRILMKLKIYISRKLEICYLLLIEKSFEYYFYLSQIIIFIDKFIHYTYSIIHDCSVYINQKLLSFCRKIKQSLKFIYERILLPIYERIKPIVLTFLSYIIRILIKIISQLFQLIKISIKVLIIVVYLVYKLVKFLIDYVLEKLKIKSFCIKIKNLSIYIFTLFAERLIYLYNSKSMLYVYLIDVIIGLKKFAILMIGRISFTLRQSHLNLITILTTLLALTLSFISFISEKSIIFYHKLKPKINALISHMVSYIYKSFNYLTCFSTEILIFLKMCLNYMALKFGIIYCHIIRMVIFIKDLLKGICLFLKSKFDHYKELAKTLINSVKNILIEQMIIVRCNISEFLKIMMQLLKSYAILVKEKIILIKAILREYFSSLKNYIIATIKETSKSLKESINSLKDFIREKILLIKAIGDDMKLYIKGTIINIKTNVNEIFSSVRVR